MHDVIVIYVGVFVELTRSQPLEDIWIASGIDKSSGSITLMQYAGAALAVRLVLFWPDHFLNF